MLGTLLAKIRKEKNITKTELSNLTDINIGHLTHIEKGDRNPSYSTLNTICNSLKIPTRPILNTSHQILTNEQLDYKYTNHIPYNKIPAISSIDTYIECPYTFSNAAFAFKMPDSSMAPLFTKNSYIFIELCGSLEDKDVGLFKYNDEFLIRRLIYKNGKFILKANNKNYNNIKVSSFDDFLIIGKAYI